jgi:replicative DNA helicase
MAKRESFELFGKKFQTRVLQGAFIDPQFFESIFEILKEQYFESEPHQIVWKEIKEFFHDYNAVPTYDNIRVATATLPDDSLKESITELMWQIEKQINNKEIEQAKKEAFTFCRNKVMKEAIIKSVDDLEQNNFDSIQQRIEEALQLTTTIEIGHEYFDCLDLRTTEDTRKAVPTGLKVLDASNYLDGGLAGGELGVVMAPTGGGKSFALVNIGYGALAHGCDVVHYTFELSETHIGKRYDARVSNIAIKEIQKNIKDVEKTLVDFKGGRLIIKEYPIKTATINTIKFHIGRLRSSGFNPGAIIIDYADLMRSRRQYDQRRFELEAIYEDCRSLAQELKLPIWTATQSNRGGFGEEIITLDKVGEAIGKAQVADVFVSISRTLEEKEKGLGKFFIAKNRFGVDGEWLPMVMDNSKAYMGLSHKLEGDESTSDLVEKAALYDDPSKIAGSPVMKELYKRMRKKEEEGGK